MDWHMLLRTKALSFITSISSILMLVGSGQSLKRQLFGCHVTDVRVRFVASFPE
jgi:hypothetical protein